VGGVRDALLKGLKAYAERVAHDMNFVVGEYLTIVQPLCRSVSCLVDREQSAQLEIHNPKLYRDDPNYNAVTITCPVCTSQATVLARFDMEARTTHAKCTIDKVLRLAENAGLLCKSLAEDFSIYTDASVVSVLRAAVAAKGAAPKEVTRNSVNGAVRDFFAFYEHLLKVGVDDPSKLTECADNSLLHTLEEALNNLGVTPAAAPAADPVMIYEVVYEVALKANLLSAAERVRRHRRRRAPAGLSTAQRVIAPQ